MSGAAEPIFAKSVVVFSAHPDDAEIYVSGLLKLLADRGWSIEICTMTAGGMGGIGSDESETVRIRLGEAAEAASLLGAGYRCLGGRDGYLYDTADLRLEALRVIREVGAGVVITHLPNDYHPDHRATAAIAEAAAMLATLPNVPLPEAPLPTTPLLYHSAPFGRTDPMGNAVSPPSFLVDIGAVQEFKTRMLGCHRSQIELMRVMFNIDDFFGAMRAQDAEWGREGGCAYAEAYWQHAGGGFPRFPLLQRELSGAVIDR